MSQTITLSASEIKTNPLVIAQANEYFKNLVAKCEERDLPHIVMTIAELGVENIFYVSRDYHGRYEDDDCTFTYWDNLNGKFIYDEWSTRYAAPSFFLYEDNIIRFADAMEAELVDMKKFIDMKAEKAYSIIDRIHVKNITDDLTHTYPRIKVDGGRKWKGNGYLVEIVEEENSFGIRSYAKVLSTEDFQIHYCNPAYIQYIDADAILDGYKTYAKDYIKDHISRGRFYDVFGDSFNKSETYINYNLMCTFGEWVKRYKNNIEGLVATAPDPEMYERNMKLAAKRAENFKDIIEWVKTNTDKTTDDEIMELALRILNKRY